MACPLVRIGPGEQPKFIASMLDPPTGRTFHMFECKCTIKLREETKTTSNNLAQN